MTACGAVGMLTVGNRIVTQLRCELDALHVEPTAIYLDPRGFEVSYSGGIDPGDPTATPLRMAPGSPHRMAFEWDVDPVPMPDADLFDPDESFDVVVEP